MKKIYLFLILTITFTPSLSHAGVIGGVEQGTFSILGKKCQIIYEAILKSTNEVVNATAKQIAVWMIKLALSLYGIYFTIRMVKVAFKKDSFTSVFINLGIFSIVMGFIYNLNYFNEFIQKPLIDTYNAFGQALLSNGSDSSSIIQELADKISTVFDGVNSVSGSILSNIGSIVVSLIIMGVLFLVFLQIFIILLKNYLWINLPFAFSPILLFFSLFKSLRQVPLKALNIVLSSIFKLGSIVVVVKIMASVFYLSLSQLNNQLNIDSLLTLLILGCIYKEFLSVGEALGSELMGTLQMNGGTGFMAFAAAGMALYKTIATSIAAGNLGAKILKSGATGHYLAGKGLVKGGMAAWKKMANSGGIGGGPNKNMANKGGKQPWTENPPKNPPADKK